VKRCPPLQERLTPAPEVRPHQLDVWKVASRDWVKYVYVINDVRGRLILGTANIVYPYESTDVFKDESMYTVPFERQGSIYNWCRHCCPGSSLPLSLAAAPWCHSCELKMNLHPRHQDYVTVACSGSKLRGNVQSCVGYRVCFGMRGIVWCKLCVSRELRILEVC